MSDDLIVDVVYGNKVLTIIAEGRAVRNAFDFHSNGVCVLHQGAIEEEDSLFDATGPLPDIAKVRLVECSDGETRLWLHYKDNDKKPEFVGCAPLDETHRIARWLETYLRPMYPDSEIAPGRPVSMRRSIIVTDDIA